MLPELADLLDGFDLYAERQGVAPTRNESAIMLFLLAVEQAHAVGVELSLEPIALQIHRLRIVRGQMAFPELRDWFTARLGPVPRREWPPK